MLIPEAAAFAGGGQDHGEAGHDQRS